MSTSYNKYRTQCQSLLALCRRNFDKFDRKDKDIFLAEQKRFHSSGGRGKKETAQ